MDEARRYAEDNPGDVNAASFPDSVRGVGSETEKVVYEVALSVAEKISGCDLSAFRNQG